MKRLVFTGLSAAVAAAGLTPVAAHAASAGTARAAAGTAGTQSTAGAPTTSITQGTATPEYLSWDDQRGYWTIMDPAGTVNPYQVRIDGGYVYGIDKVLEVAYSADGSRVALVVQHPNASSPELWVAASDATGAGAVYQPTGTVSLANLTWTPDNASVVFTESAGGTKTVKTVPADKSAAPKPFFTGAVSGADHVVFSSKGRLAYESGGNVVVADAATQSVQKTLTGFRDPIFSPDGNRLLVIDSAGNLVAMDPDGTNQVTLAHAGTSADGTTFVDQAVWSPDGNRVAYLLRTRYSSTQLPDSEEIWETDSGGLTSATQVGPTKQPVEYFVHLNWAPAYAPAPGSGGTPTPTPTGGGTLQRLGGSDRVDTAITVADTSYGTAKATIAVLSRSDNFADALAGNALAAQKKGPLLLTGTAALDPRVKDALKRNVQPGGTVYVLGGVNALSPAVANAVQSLGFTVKRLEGQNRYATATRIAAEISPRPHTVMVATGRNFPDALAAGAAAASDPAGGVVILSDDAALPPESKAYLAGVDPVTTAMYGVGRQGYKAFTTMPVTYSARVIPLAGQTRYETALAVAGNGTLFTNPTMAGIATGAAWPDALAGGAMVGAGHGPLLLADGDSLISDELIWLHMQGLARHFTQLEVFGGTNAVPDSAATGAADAAWGAGKWTRK